jgi:glutathione S-transferase
MAYTLIGSLRSPFTRLTRLFLLRNKIDFELKAINYLDSKEDEAYLARVSPINKIPLLLDGDKPLFDSRVIFNVLSRRHGVKELSVDDENHLTAVNTCTETSVNLFLLKKGGMDTSQPNWFVERERERITLCLTFLEPWVKALSPSREQDWGYPAMALFSYLDWAIFRELIDLSPFPALREFHERFQNAPGVAATDFRS